MVALTHQRYPLVTYRLDYCNAFYVEAAREDCPEVTVGTEWCVESSCQ